MIQENLEMNMKILKAGFGSWETIREENVFLVFFIATKQKKLDILSIFPLVISKIQTELKVLQEKSEFFRRTNRWWF